MPKSVQEYVVGVTEKAAKELLAAAMETPEDRRDWSPLDKGRTVIDQVAECALLNGYTAQVLEDRNWAPTAFANYPEEKAAIVTDWGTVSAALEAGLPRLTAAIRGLSDEDLELVLETPFGPMSMEQIASYPVWNMTYHQGQVTYVGILN
ncbi:MAG: DinB family protein [Capsulimonas sp.]|uniref:DinB family protein n=1 Tax=Capsulimonas sp. TaxID=2494211 RepID=UPI003263B3FF